MITLTMPSAKAGSVPGRTMITSSALLDVDLVLGRDRDDLTSPCRRASVSQWASGILVEIQFMPHADDQLRVLGGGQVEVDGLLAAGHGVAGGRSVCQE